MSCGSVLAELFPQSIAFLAGLHYGILAGGTLADKFFVFEGRCFSGIFELCTFVTIRHADILSVRYSTPLWTKISSERSRCESQSPMSSICTPFLHAM